MLQQLITLEIKEKNKIAFLPIYPPFMKLKCCVLLKGEGQGDVGKVMSYLLR